MGKSQEAVGNRWADTLARMVPACHEVPDEDLLAVKASRAKQGSVLKWMGRAAAIHEQPGILPRETPKVEWPMRTAKDRRTLAKERATSTGNVPQEAPQQLTLLPGR